MQGKKERGERREGEKKEKRREGRKKREKRKKVNQSVSQLKYQFLCIVSACS